MGLGLSNEVQFRVSLGGLLAYDGIGSHETIRDHLGQWISNLDCMLTAIFKTSPQSVSDLGSLLGVQESALLKANPKCSDSGS